MIHCVELTENDCVTDDTDDTVTFYIDYKNIHYICLIYFNKSYGDNGDNGDNPCNYWG